MLLPICLQGIQYVMNGSKCRVRPVPHVMNRMCLPGNIVWYYIINLIT